MLTCFEREHWSFKLDKLVSIGPWSRRIFSEIHLWQILQIQSTTRVLRKPVIVETQVASVPSLPEGKPLAFSEEYIYPQNTTFNRHRTLAYGQVSITRTDQTKPVFNPIYVW